MKINVVIPSYNCEKYLYDTVNSVISQDYDDLRIIIVDDGSKDSTKEISLKLKEQNDNIVYIYQDNAGVSCARNTGIDYVIKNRVGFEYIIFLDSDDMWRKSFFNENVKSALEAKTDVLGFEMCRCSNDMKKAASKNRLLKTPDGDPLEKEYSVVNGGADNIRCLDEAHMGSIFYSVEMIEKYGIRFFDGLKFSEDKIFKIQCLYAAEEIGLFTRVLYLYRNVSSSAMHTASFNTEYYKTIIDSYIKCDKQMLEIKNDSKKELMWGRILAARYTAQITDEMYKMFVPKAKVKAFFKENQYLIENLKQYGTLAPNTKAWLKVYEASEEKYILRQRIAGIKQFFRNKLKKMSYFRKMYHNNTYSNENKYI